MGFLGFFLHSLFHQLSLIRSYDHITKTKMVQPKVDFLCDFGRDDYRLHVN
jgi:hypothetical protein